MIHKTNYTLSDSYLFNLSFNDLVLTNSDAVNATKVRSKALRSSFALESYARDLRSSLTLELYTRVSSFDSIKGWHP
jgi:hypothetical protein